MVKLTEQAFLCSHAPPHVVNIPCSFNDYHNTKPTAEKEEIEEMGDS